MDRMMAAMRVCSRPFGRGRICLAHMIHNALAIRPTVTRRRALYQLQVSARSSIRWRSCTNVCLMLGQRLRRCPNIKQTLCQNVLFTGSNRFVQSSQCRYPGDSWRKLNSFYSSLAVGPVFSSLYQPRRQFRYLSSLDKNSAKSRADSHNAMRSVL